MLRTIFVASSLLIAAAGHHAHAQEPSNLYLVKQQLVQYQEKGGYLADLKAQVAKARQYLALRITENNQQPKKQKLAIVLDIDETTLSNYQFMKDNNFGGTFKAFDDNLKTQILPSIKPMKAFYEFANQNNVAVFFVTGRRPNVKSETISNLKQSGYNKWQGLYFKPQDYNQSSVIPYKASIRKKIAEKGYTIVASIGDQLSDLKGGYAEKTYKLPNPFYYIP